MGDFEDSEADVGNSQESEFDGIRILGADRASDVVNENFATDSDDDSLIEDEEISEDSMLAHRSLDQHWTDPPTGQVPAILIDDSKDITFEEVSAHTAVWRTEHHRDEELDLDLGFITEDVPAIKDHNADREDESDNSDSNQSFISDKVKENFVDAAIGEESKDDFNNMDRISRRRASELKAKKRPVKKLIDTEIQSERPPKKRSTIPKDVTEGDAPERSNTYLRVITGLLIAGIASLIFYTGTALGLFLVIFVALMAILEFNTAILKVGFKPAGIVAVFGVVASVLGAYLRGTSALLAMIGLTVGTVFSWYIFSDSDEKRQERPVANIGVTFLGFIWIGFFASFAALILSPNQYPHKHGIAYLVAVLTMAVANDVGAFAAGKKFGRGKNHLFAKNISPNKTWEGFIGGAVLTFIFGIIIGSTFFPWNISHAVEMAGLISIFSPLGDLIESMLKRDLKLKDFGSVLPGHGGILDRIDGILLCLPMAYVYLQLMHLS